MADAKSCLSKDILKEIVLSLCERFKIPSLYQDQLEPLYNFLRGLDVFVNKPTGSGKSIIFQMAPYAEMALAQGWQIFIYYFFFYLLLVLKEDFF